MTEFLFKSGISLAVLYGFYFLLLRNTKTYGFNRFFLLFSIAFSMIIPFIIIPTEISHTISADIKTLSLSATELINGNAVSDTTKSIFTTNNILLTVYLLVVLTLFLRFIKNLSRLIRKIIKNKKIKKGHFTFVLIEEQTLPYTFLKYIFVNRKDFESGKIEDELLLHEKTHCTQYHSLDILFIEVLKMALWFNPFIWLYKKAIQLNHEFLADAHVLSMHEAIGYQKIILNHVFRNNSTYLASNFNYSLTKKRLIMMARNNSSNSTIRKIAAIPLFMMLAFTLTFAQKIESKMSINMDYENEWWYPILQKHNLKLQAFNNFGSIFEMGSSNSINDGVVTLKDAYFIIKSEDGKYVILESPLAYHDLKKNKLEGNEGILKTYDNESTSPTEEFVFKDFSFDIKDDKYNFKANSIEGVQHPTK